MLESSFLVPNEYQRITLLLFNSCNLMSFYIFTYIKEFFMEQYSRRFIEELANHIDPVIIDYFNKKKNLLHFSTAGVTELIDETLMDYLDGKSSREDLIPIINKIKKSRLQKRSRWYKSYINDIDTINIDDPKHPLANIVVMAKTLPVDDYTKMFGDKDLDEIIDDKKKAATQWKNDSNSLLIDFPGISSLTNNSIYNSLKNDLIISAWKYIEDELAGNIDSYLRLFPVDLVDKPLFSPSSFTLMMDTASNNLLKEIITDEDGKELLEVTVDSGKLTPPKAMDSNDLKLVNAFISNINMQEFYKEKSVVVDLNTLGKEVVDYHVGKNVIKKISNSCRKLVEYNFSYEEAGSKIYFNLFDNIVIKEDVERPYAIAQFCEILSNAIIKKKLISITSASYDVLDNNLSRIICYAMKREQIANQETFIGEYNYTYFQKIVRFKLKNKKKNLQLIKESLQEFVDNNIVIDSFELKNNVFIIKFLPLSAAEIQDLNFDKTKVIDVPTDFD